MWPRTEPRLPEFAQAVKCNAWLPFETNSSVRRPALVLATNNSTFCQRLLLPSSLPSWQTSCQLLSQLSWHTWFCLFHPHSCWKYGECAETHQPLRTTEYRHTPIALIPLQRYNTSKSHITLQFLSNHWSGTSIKDHKPMHHNWQQTMWPVSIHQVYLNASPEETPAYQIYTN